MTNKKSNKNRATGNPFWISSLFNEVYLLNDVPRKYKKYWSDDAHPGFDQFLGKFRNLVDDLNSEDFDSWSETDTIDNWIQPVMRLLGWHDKCASRNISPIIKELSLSIIERGNPKSYRPDLLYVDDPEFKKFVASHKDKKRRLDEARSGDTGAIMVLEAKYWDRLEEEKQNIKAKKSKQDTKGDPSTDSLSPNYQILKYLEVLQKSFGILTDGKKWRLFHNELSRSDIPRYYEFDLGNLRALVERGLEDSKRYEHFVEQARYFYFFFAKECLHQSTKTAPMVLEILNYSKTYADSIEEDLKSRFISAMTYLCNGLLESCVESGEEPDTDLIRNVAESHLFNILFIRSCESRKILPIDPPDYHQISIKELIESLDVMRFDPSKKTFKIYQKYFEVMFGDGFETGGREVYDRILRLYKVVHDGTTTKDDFGFEISGFQESIFTKKEWAFAKKHRVSNEYMLLALFTLSFVEADNVPGRTYQQIAYNYFSPRQLGSIYESFLGYEIQVAQQSKYLKHKKWEDFKSKAPEDAEMTVKKSQLFFDKDNTKRKNQGTYYTHDYIVENIVTNALEPLVKGKNSRDIAKLRICDPALGSGHFINFVLRFLTESYREQLSKEGKELGSYEADAQFILSQCVFGSDIDFRALKLAKMNLWLLTAIPGRALENLDYQLIRGDSLLKIRLDGRKFVDWRKEIFDPKGFDSFDAIVGNPPYGAKLSDPTKEHYKSVYDIGTTDTAALMMKLAYDLTGKNSSVSMIVPKSFTYSSTWKKLRELFLPELVSLIDSGKAWKDVKLEQSIFLLKKGKISHEFDSYVRQGEEFVFLGGVNKDDCRDFEMYLNGVSQQEVNVAQKMRSTGKFLGSVTSNVRGAPLQRLVKENRAKYSVLGGKQLGNMVIRDSKGYIDKSNAIPDKACIVENSILVQNILAHVTRPIDHVKVIGLVGDLAEENNVLLDTVNQIAVSGGWSNKYILGLLYSHPVNWYIYRFLVGKAIRTIHFDAPITDRIPLPDVGQPNKTVRDIEKVVEKIQRLSGKALVETSKRTLQNLTVQINEARLVLDQSVYELFDLSEDEIETIESTNPILLNQLQNSKVAS